MAKPHTFYAQHLVDALLEEGIPAESIWQLNGWQTNQQGYYWTEVGSDRHRGYDGIANGHLYHHTATTAYTPYVKNSNGQTKANVWVGLRRGDRLYQDGGGVPTLAIASAGPANYSSGSGVEEYVEALRRSEKRGAQRASDDSPKWYGNRYTFNTEVICDGVGGRVDDSVWDLLVLYGAALARLHDAREGWNGFHQGFTKRKIDYRDGRYSNATQTLEALWAGIAEKLSGSPERPPEQPEKPPTEPPPGGDKPMTDLARSMSYFDARRSDLTGFDVEYWQNMIIQLGTGDLDTGVSNRAYFTRQAEAYPDTVGTLTFKVWDDAMTTYATSVLGRDAYGLGPSERKIIEQRHTLMLTRERD